MATNYPTSLDTSTELPSPSTGATVPAADDTNRSLAIIAVETKVGTGASTPTNGTVLKGTGAGTSAYGTVDSGDVASDLVTGQGLVTAVGTDHVLLADASDSGNLKKALISDFASAGGDMAAATYDPNTVAGDAFDMDNMVEGDGKIMTAAERSAITANTAKTTYPGASAAETYTNKSIDADTNTVTNIGAAEFDTDTQDSFDLMIAAALDSPAVTVASNGTVVTLSMEKSGTGDIRFVFSDGVHTHDCTPVDTVTLTAGSDTSPQINYIYVLQSDKTLTASTTAYPSAEHAPVATVLVQSAASAQTDGVFKMHAWTDHVKGSSDSNGHLAHLNYWVRNQPATWTSGVACTPTVGAGQFDIATSAGVALQLHQHDFPAFDTAGSGDDIYVVNDPDTAYKKVGDLLLASVGKDANGTTLGDTATDFYNLVIWGAVNEADGDCKLFVNVPDGAYNSDAGGKASNDDDNTAVYNIPADFTGVGFLIARLTVSESGGTYTIEQNEDLRGKFPGTAAGGGAVGGNEFADNVFRIQDDGDTTKEIAFQASGITAGNAREITMPDADVDLADVNDLPVANLADGTDGELITWDAAGAPATVGAGTAAQILTSNGAGTAPTFQDAAGGGGGQTLYSKILATSGGDYTDAATAMAALSADESLFVKPGTFTVTSDLDVGTGNLHIIGENRASSIIEFDVTGGTSTWSGGYMTLENLTIKVVDTGTFKVSGAWSKMKNCIILLSDSSGANAFHFNSTYGDFSNNYIYDTSSANTSKLKLDGSFMKIDDNIFSSTTGSGSAFTGWILNNNSSNSFNNNFIRVSGESTSGAVSYSGRAATNCTFYGTSSSCAFAPNTNGGVWSNNNMQAGLKFMYCGNNDYLTICNNHVNTSYSGAIGIDGLGASCTVSGNVFRGHATGSTAIVAGNSQNNSAITGNTFVTWATGISVGFSGTTDTLLASNNFDGNVTTAISDSGTTTFYQTATDSDPLNQIT